MQARTHASLGAWTLGPTPPALAWGDALGSIGLVGNHTSTGFGAHVRTDDELTVVSVEEPIEAARRWLQGAAERGALPDDVREVAEQTLHVARTHLRELDLLAGEVAIDANETGEVDQARLDRVDAMAGLMEQYSNRMRGLLEPEAYHSDEIGRRIRRGLDAAEQGGGLAALVAAL